MRWIKLSPDTIPEIGKDILLFGTDSLNGHECFRVGVNDKVYGILPNHGPFMNTTHWCYCEKPEVLKRG